MHRLLGILSVLAVWQYALASNCPVVQEEFRNGNQTSSTGYRLSSYFPDHEYYIPQCTAGGLFERIQCTSLNQSVPLPPHNPSIQCWCVDPVTGISVDVDGGYGPKNASECDTITTFNTTALCKERSVFATTPGSCTFHDCSIGPPVILIVDCYSIECPLFQRAVRGPGCCDFTCVGRVGSSGLTVTEEAIIAVTVVAFVLVIIVIIIAVVVICCVVCKKTKVTKSAHPVAVNNAQFTGLDEKVDLSKEDQA